MTINGLNALTALTAGDEIPVWDAEASGEEPTKKITASNLSSSVKSLAGLQNANDVDGRINAKQVSAEVDISMFTSINSHVDTSRFFRIRVGNVVYLSICLTGGIANNTKLFDINSAIVPRQQNTPCMIFNSNGNLVTNASVWLEASNTGKLTFYGTALPSPGTYFLSLTYVI